MRDKGTADLSDTALSEGAQDVERDPRFANDGSDDPSLVSLLNVLLRHRWKVAGTPIVTAVLVGIFCVAFSSTTYTSEASFVPEAGPDVQTGRLSGLASQFGLEIPSAPQGQSPQFYRELLRSRRILQKAVTSEYVIHPPGSLNLESVASYDLFPGDSGGSAPSGVADRDSLRPRASERTATLVEFFGIDKPEPAARKASAVRLLRQSISVNADPQTGLIEFSVSTENPAVSRQVAATLVELVNQYNLEVRQSRGAAEASFAQERLTAARVELRAAEDSLESFLEQNRRIGNSPRLQFELDRLERRVELKQSVVNSLSQSYEQARISQVRNTPVITMVEAPDLPLSPDPNRFLFRLAIGFLLGGLVGGFWAFGADIMVSDRDENPDEYREFDRLRLELSRELRLGGKRIVRILRSLRSISL